MEGSDSSGEKLLELLSLGKRRLRRRGFNLKTKHLLRSTQPFSTLKIFFFFFGFKNHKCHNVCQSHRIEISLSGVSLGPVLVWPVRSSSATLAARSAPCQTPGCSSQSAPPGWSWCGCSVPLRRTPASRQLAGGTGRSRRRSAPPAPGPSQ